MVVTENHRFNIALLQNRFKLTVVDGGRAGRFIQLSARCVLRIENIILFAVPNSAVRSLRNFEKRVKNFGHYYVLKHY